LQGNLALNFLFKDQDLSEIIKIKTGNTNQSSMNASIIDTRATQTIVGDDNYESRLSTLGSVIT
jgi:hypothetical protein